MLSILEPLLLKILFPDPNHRITATLISLIITRLIIFPWQLIGLLRAVDKDYINHGDTIKTRSIQALMILSVLFTLIYITGSIQTVLYDKKQATLLAIDNEIEPLGYTLLLQNNTQKLLITGSIEIGITQAVELLIKRNRSLSSVVLESTGGHIYEGRGLSKLFTKYQLDTYSYEECSSACATAFIGGKRRYLGKNGKIGFHQYKQDMSKFPKAVPFHNLVDEQNRDKELFKSQGIKQQFIDKVFDQTADGIWFPKHSELLKAGVVHAMLPSDK